MPTTSAIAGNQPCPVDRTDGPRPTLIFINEVDRSQHLQSWEEKRFPPRSPDDSERQPPLLSSCIDYGCVWLRSPLQQKDLFLTEETC